MRWDNLFDDLEGQLEHELHAEEVDLRGEEERLRLGRLSLRDRLVALCETRDGQAAPVRLVLRDGTMLRLGPRSFGKDWLAGDLLGETRPLSQAVLPLAAVGSLVLDRERVAESLVRQGARTPAGPVPGGLSDRLSLAFVLRDLCRRRRPLDLVLSGTTLHGTLDRVGRDHCDLAVHESGSVRRESDVIQYRLVPLAQLLLVRM